jgi:hypothetical protein
MKISEILVEAPNVKAIADLIKQNPNLTQAQIAAILKGGRQNLSIDAVGGKGADVSKAVAKPKAAPAPRGGGADRMPVAKPKAAPAPRGGGADRMPVAKTKKAPTPMDAGEFASTPVVKPKKAPTPMDAGEFASTPVVKPKKSAIVNRGAKAGQTASAAGEFGSNKPRANIASTTNMSGAATNQQAANKFKQAKPDVSVPNTVAKPAKKIGIQPGKTPSADTMDNRNK